MPIAIRRSKNGPAILPQMIALGSDVTAFEWSRCEAYLYDAGAADVSITVEQEEEQQLEGRETKDGGSIIITSPINQSRHQSITRNGRNDESQS